MRLAELTVPELLALANILLRIAEEIPVEDRRATREARDEIAYVLQLISEKEDASHTGARRSSMRSLN